MTPGVIDVLISPSQKLMQFNQITFLRPNPTGRWWGLEQSPKANIFVTKDIGNCFPMSLSTLVKFSAQTSVHF